MKEIIVSFYYKNENVIALVYREHDNACKNLVSLNVKGLCWTNIDSWKNLGDLNQFTVLPKGTRFSIV